MKHSSTWFASILIASALLLGAGNGNPESARVQSTPQANQPNSNQRIGQPSSLSTETIEANQARELRDDSDREADIQARIAALTRWLVIAAFLQLVASAIAAAAARQAAKASRDSAEAGQLALHSDRPFLFIEKPDFHPAERGKMSAVFYLRNRGKGPAIIHELRAGLKFTNSRKSASSDFPQRADYRRTAVIEVTDNVLGAGDPSDRYEAWLENENLTLGEIHSGKASGQRELVLCGVVSFHDSLGDWEYEAGFCWSLRVNDRFRPPYFGQIEGYNEIKKR
jgi:hypothetical protein